MSFMTEQIVELTPEILARINVGKAMQHVSLASIPDTAPYKAALSTYTTRIVECVNKGVGLFLWGDTRTGKTCAAAIVAKTAAAHGGKVYFTRADEMIHAIMERERFINGTTETTVEKRVLEVDLLIIDELSEPADVKEKRVIERIIRQRQDRQRATVLTTNLTKDALRNAYGEPFLQSVEEHTVRLPVFGVNWHEMGKDRMSTFLAQGPQGGVK